MNKFKSKKLKDLNLGVIGNGFVGSSVSSGFRHYCNSIKVFDKDPKKSCNSIEEVLDSDITFVCVPTPMSQSGECDLRAINEVFSLAEKNKANCTFVIKSTIPIGTTDTLAENYKQLFIFHSPEFLTARSAQIDFISPSRNIIGWSSVGDCTSYASECHARLHILKDCLKERFPGVPCLTMKSDESEMVKYVANCFFASKVSFFNEMHMLSSQLELDWENIMEGVLSDGRIGISHYQVPGHDGDFGFGGSCFPKDINSLISIMKNNNIDPLMLKAAWQRNLSVRKNADWEYNSSAVSNPKNRKLE